MPTIYFGVLVSLSMIGGMAGNLIDPAALVEADHPRDEVSPPADEVPEHRAVTGAGAWLSEGTTSLAETLRQQVEKGLSLFAARFLEYRLFGKLSRSLRIKSANLCNH